MNDAFIEDSKVVLSLCAEAFVNGRIKKYDAAIISDCADDFLKFQAWRVTRFKKTGVMHEPPEDMPNLHLLIVFLMGEDYSAALDEAKYILAATKPILKQCEERYKEYVRPSGTVVAPTSCSRFA